LTEPRYIWPNIRRLLEEGFSREELRKFIGDDPEFRPLYNDIAWDGNIAHSQIVDGLMRYAQRRLRIDALLEWAGKKNLRQYKRLGPYLRAESVATEGRPGAMQPDQIKRFLDRASFVPEAREAVASARKSLEYNCRKINLMSEYKETHDWLQVIDLAYRSLYSQLYDERGELLPLQWQDWSKSASSSDALQIHIATLVEQVERMSFRADAEEWLDGLRESEAGLEKAYEDKDTSLLDTVLLNIDDVVSSVTSPINNRLIGAIDALELSDLVGELRCVYEIVLAHGDGAMVGGFRESEKAITDLGSISDRLSASREEHDSWQQLDNMLRDEQKQIEAGFNVGRFKRKWKRILRGKMLALCTPLEPGREQVPNGKISQLDEELAKKPVEPNKVIDAFRQCRSAATKRFNEVDGTLKDLCTELKTKAALWG
jgi:hypothetical protein